MWGLYRDIDGNPKRRETTILLGNVSGLLERSAPSFLGSSAVRFQREVRKTLRERCVVVTGVEVVLEGPCASRIHPAMTYR